MAKKRTKHHARATTLLCRADGVLLCVLSACAGDDVPQAIVDAIWASAELLSEAKRELSRVA